MVCVAAVAVGGRGLELVLLILFWGRNMRMKINVFIVCRVIIDLI